MVIHSPTFFKTTLLITSSRQVRKGRHVYSQTTFARTVPLPRPAPYLPRLARSSCNLGSEVKFHSLSNPKLKITPTRSASAPRPASGLSDLGVSKSPSVPPTRDFNPLSPPPSFDPAKPYKFPSSAREYSTSSDSSPSPTAPPQS